MYHSKDEDVQENTGFWCRLAEHRPLSRCILKQNLRLHQPLLSFLSKSFRPEWPAEFFSVFSIKWRLNVAKTKHGGCLKTFSKNSRACYRNVPSQPTDSFVRFWTKGPGRKRNFQANWKSCAPLRRLLIILHWVFCPVMLCQILPTDLRVFNLAGSRRVTQMLRFCPFVAKTRDTGIFQQLRTIPDLQASRFWESKMRKVGRKSKPSFSVQISSEQEHLRTSEWMEMHHELWRGRWRWRRGAGGAFIGRRAARAITQHCRLTTCLLLRVTVAPSSFPQSYCLTHSYLLPTCRFMSCTSAFLQQSCGKKYTLNRFWLRWRDTQLSIFLVIVFQSALLLRCFINLRDPDVRKCPGSFRSTKLELFEHNYWSELDINFQRVVDSTKTCFEGDHKFPHTPRLRSSFDQQGLGPGDNLSKLDACSCVCACLQMNIASKRSQDFSQGQHFSSRENCVVPLLLLSPALSLLHYHFSSQSLQSSVLWSLSLPCWQKLQLCSSMFWSDFSLNNIFMQESNVIVFGVSWRGPGTPGSSTACRHLQVVCRLGETPWSSATHVFSRQQITGRNLSNNKNIPCARWSWPDLTPKI